MQTKYIFLSLFLGACQTKPYNTPGNEPVIVEKNVSDNGSYTGYIEKQIIVSNPLDRTVFVDVKCDLNYSKPTDDDYEIKNEKLNIDILYFIEPHVSRWHFIKVKASGAIYNVCQISQFGDRECADH